MRVVAVSASEGAYCSGSRLRFGAAGGWWLALAVCVASGWLTLLVWMPLLLCPGVWWLGLIATPLPRRQDPDDLGRGLRHVLDQDCLAAARALELIRATMTSRVRVRVPCLRNLPSQCWTEAGRAAGQASTVSCRFRLAIRGKKNKGPGVLQGKPAPSANRPAGGQEPVGTLETSLAAESLHRGLPRKLELKNRDAGVDGLDAGLGDPHGRLLADLEQTLQRLF